MNSNKKTLPPETVDIRIEKNDNIYTTFRKDDAIDIYAELKFFSEFSKSGDGDYIIYFGKWDNRHQSIENPSYVWYDGNIGFHNLGNVTEEEASRVAEEKLRSHIRKKLHMATE